MTERRLAWVVPGVLPFLDGLPDSVEVVPYPAAPLEDPRAGEVRFLVPPFNANYADLIGALGSLEVIQTISAGVDTVVGSLPATVTLCSARGTHDGPVAEWCLAATLAGLRHFAFFHEEQLAGRATRRTATELSRARVTILGYGSIGAAVERMLAGFGPKVTRVARSARAGVSSVEDLDEILPATDVLIVLLPLTPDTRGLLDGTRLARLPDGALIVNAARGPIIDTAALLAELERGRLRAVLDVTDPEPLPADHPLRTVSGVLITPHVAGGTVGGMDDVYRFVAAQLGRYARGEALENVVTDGY